MLIDDRNVVALPERVKLWPEQEQDAGSCDWLVREHGGKAMAQLGRWVRSVQGNTNLVGKPPAARGSWSTLLHIIREQGR